MIRRRYESVCALLPTAEQARVESFRRERSRDSSDVYGGDADRLALAYALGYWFYRYYFRVRSFDRDRLPRRGAAVVVGNHSGVLPFDAIMLGVDVFRATQPPRLLHYMVDYFAFRLPFVGMLFQDLGQLAGTRRNFDGLIEAGHLVGVFPEGAQALGKLASQRYELFPFNPGHVELAARHQVPVIPVGIVGAEEQQTMLRDVRPLARALRLPYFPITTTFPWFGPFGLLPKPVRYFINYGEPIDIDPEAARSVSCRSAEVERVREAVRRQIDQGRRRRDTGEVGCV